MKYKNYLEYIKMNRSNRNIKSENKKREHTKQDIPEVTRHKIEDEDAHTAMEGHYHLSQRRDDTDISTVYRGPQDPSGRLEVVYTRKINFLKAVNSFKYLERKKIEELETGKSYLIEQVEKTTTKYGDALIAILRGPSDDVGSALQFKVFLPKRFLTHLSDEHIEYMNEGGIYLKFIGGKYNDLEFH